MASFHLVFAAPRTGGIGKDGRLPWPSLKEDMKWFRSLTLPSTPDTRSVVIMGAKTWLSLPSKPLKGRINVIISSQSREALNAPPEVQICSALDVALAFAVWTPKVAKVLVIGGQRLYEEAQNHCLCRGAYVTEILTPDYPCDVRFRLNSSFKLREASSVIHTEGTVHYQSLIYDRVPVGGAAAPVPLPAAAPVTAVALPLPGEAAAPAAAVLLPGEVPVEDCKSCLDGPPGPDGPLGRAGAATPTVALKPALPLPGAPALPIVIAVEIKSANPEEQHYLDMVADIIETGVKKMDRTGVGTFSKFGCMAKYNLADGSIPCLTTKRVFWRGVVEELIWLINGRTHARELQAKGVDIWNDNGTRAFLDSLGLTDREEFDLGPIYGHQWRHFGAPYVGAKTADSKISYEGQGVDQLTELITAIKTAPGSRRLVMSAWNPAQLKEMALPPCHVLCQFYVREGSLDCVMYQRSCDMGLGVPFNIASYSLLTHMIAHVCGLKPGVFTHMMGDTHVYLTHVDPLMEQIKRTPTPFPKLRIKRPITDITTWTFADVELIGYTPQSNIKMAMAV